MPSRWEMFEYSGKACQLGGRCVNFHTTYDKVMEGVTMTCSNRGVTFFENLATSYRFGSLFEWSDGGGDGGDGGGGGSIASELQPPQASLGNIYICIFIGFCRLI